MRYAQTTALITGASSGIGQEFARRLAERGADLVLVARRGTKLEALAQELRRRHAITVTVVPADLSQPGAATTVRAALDAAGITLSTLINSAGLGATGPFATSDVDTVHDQLAVNVAALTELTRELLPDLLSRGDGALINLASFVGYQPGPGQTVYAASKAYVLSFTEALAHEHRDSAVRIMALSPGSTRTEFYASSGTSEKGARFETPDQVVATALRALDAGRTPARVVSGGANRLILRVFRWLPRRVVLNVLANSVHPA
ncbi:SDR family NAD(P)-dependent oxidoreductase [Actinoplanes friuliensis]|uniref:Oxidoreductase n=1 Tax=Actinoplanes friuliensis DSM 7358 TaxID=1246995 RepID=U5VVF2_9ACTN|nr:SDR family oxidoreductase [Actinoplanes friuliensis]AGZ40983.1 oxidoreductase [Actinoplanes friuliensis DSM 7358]